MEYLEIEFENGDVYKGTVKDKEIITGLGYFEKKGKFVYCGEFENGLFNGVGRLVDSEKFMVYQGEFRQGKKEGRGRLETYNSNFALGGY